MKVMLATLAIAAAFLCSTAYARAQNVNINYSVWVGDNVDVAYSRIFNVPYNSTFFEAMTVAAEIDERFVFEAELTSAFGHFIISIGGARHDPANNLFWFIYILGEEPNVNEKPTDDLLSNYGVDNFVVQDGNNYLFWLRTFVPHA